MLQQVCLSSFDVDSTTVLWHLLNFVDKSKGFAFVEYEDVRDASDAIENMDGGELYGKVLRCNVAKAVSKLAPGKAVWSSDEYAQQKEANQDGEEDNIADLKLIPEKNPLMVEDDDRDADAE